LLPEWVRANLKGRLGSLDFPAAPFYCPLQNLSAFISLATSNCRFMACSGATGAESKKETPVMNSQLPKGYDPGQIEQKWFHIWEERGDFHADEKLLNRAIRTLFRHRM